MYMYKPALFSDGPPCTSVSLSNSSPRAATSSPVCYHVCFSKEKTGSIIRETEVNDFIKKLGRTDTLLSLLIYLSLSHTPMHVCSFPFLSHWLLKIIHWNFSVICFARQYVNGHNSAIVHSAVIILSLTFAWLKQGR